MSPLPHGFLKIFTSGRYHRHMKIPKILVSNSNQFRFYGIFKKYKLMIEWGEREEGGAKYYIFLDNFCLK